MEKNILLVGFMGSGKTSAGKRLSVALKREFIDMDDFIEKREGITINEIFAQKGESYFRGLEKEHRSIPNKMGFAPGNAHSFPFSSGFGFHGLRNFSKTLTPSR